MSLAALLWASDLPISTCNLTAYRVLVKLADHADDLGYGAWPGIASLAERLEVSDRTIYRALAALVDADLIRRGDQRQVAHIDARYRPVVYDVLTPALRAAETRGDNRVRSARSRGDSEARLGVTPAVNRTVLNPSTKTSPVTHDSNRERAYGRSA